MTQVVNRKQSPVERYGPLGYFGLALVLVAVLLPTALRPPQDNPATQTEFSPDAPPDDTQESIMSAFSRGQSGTAGAGTGTGVGDGVAGEESVFEPEAPPRACPRGFGDPPRQTFSLYSAPCAPAWSGDNGGSTYEGVTATEIRVAVGLGTEDTGTDGEVQEQPGINESAQDRTWRVYQQWFNDNYQFYGRQLRLYVADGGESPEAQRSAAQTAADEYRVFGGAMIRNHAVDELARKRRVAFPMVQDSYAASWLEERAPYAYTWEMNTTKMMRLAAEYVCQKLVGRPAQFARDFLIRDDERVFGLVHLDSGEPGMRPGPELPGLLQEMCGAEFADVVVFRSQGTGAEDAEAVGTAISRFRTRGVTSVVVAVDWGAVAALTNTAESQRFGPEWILTGFHTVMWNTFGRFFQRDQWQHAFGISPVEVPRPLAELDFVRAYKEIDPGGMPHRDTAERIFPALVQIANGIQRAGPELTPQTFERGLFSQGRRPPEPSWSVGGGYGRGDRSYSDYVAEVWWDPTGYDPTARNQPGAYRYVDGGRRYTIGEFTTAETRVFEDGITHVGEQ